MPLGLGRICVKKFNDLNGNGKQDKGEPTLTGWAFTVIDSAGTVVGQVKAGDCITVKPGIYTVHEQVQPGWTVTTPNPQKVKVKAGQTVNLVFGNKIKPEESCCQFGLRLYNTLKDTIKQIVIIPASPQAILGVYNEEEPEYTLSKSGNQYIIKPADGFFPADSAEMLDLDFAIRVDPAKSPTSVTLRWLDANGQILKEERLDLKCQKNAGEDVVYDWLKTRKRISGVDDKELFAGAEQEECDEFDKEEMALVCSFGVQPKCSAGNNVLQLISNYTDASSYSWEVNDNGTTALLDGQTADYSLSEGPNVIAVKLTITYPDPGNPGQYNTESCSDTISICVPTAEFNLGTPIAICDHGNLIGYIVDITSLDQDCYYNGDPTVGQVTLNYGDGTTGNYTPPLNIPPHKYHWPCQDHYDIESVVTDIWGCIHKAKHTVTISRECEPRFSIEYALCQTRETAVPVSVTFVNDSQIFCDSKFAWDFGDPSSGSNSAATTLPDTVSHTYIYNGQQAPKDYTVTLTMFDNPCTAGKKIAATFTLKPVTLAVNAWVCPNGQTHFILQTSADWNKWELTPSPAFLSQCWLNLAWANICHNKQFTCTLEDGDYTVSATATETDTTSSPLVSVKRTCTKGLDFTVKRTCCDQFKVKDHRNFTQNSKNYRMKFKHKVVIPTLWPDTRIVGKTKFKARKKIRIFGHDIYFYKGIRARVIFVNIDDNLRAGGPLPNNPNIYCDRCITPVHFVGNVQRNYSSKATYSDHVPAQGIDQNDLLASTHHVQHQDGWDYTITVQKPVGNTCDNFTITP